MLRQLTPDWLHHSTAPSPSFASSSPSTSATATATPTQPEKMEEHMECDEKPCFLQQVMGEAGEPRHIATTTPDHLISGISVSKH